MFTSKKTFFIFFLAATAVFGIFLYTKTPKISVISDNFSAGPQEGVQNNSEAEKPDASAGVNDNNDQELKNMIGQMLLLGFRGTEIKEDSSFSETIKNVKPGGLILFDYDVPSKSHPRNIINPQQTKKLVSDLQSLSSTPLFVSVDAEGGKVNRLKSDYGFQLIMSAEEMGQKGLETTRQESKKLAQQLKALGFNMNFAPVVDVNVNPQNPVIGKLDRSFSSDEQKVAQYAKVFIEEQQSAGIIPVAKHFPGHGSSATDSHLGIVDVTNTYQQKELVPYYELAKENLLEAVMTAHIINKNIDEKYPATLSEKFLQNILREQIGFNGLIISDDMQMDAISKNFGLKETLIRAINSGCNMLLLSNNGSQDYDNQLAQKALDIIFEAVKSGEIPEEKIESSYNLILGLKNKFQLDLMVF